MALFDKKKSETPEAVDSSVGDSAAVDAAEVAAGDDYRKPTTDEIKEIVARLRHRGFTNPMYDDPAASFKEANPGWEPIWEYSPPDTKDQHEVMVRASMGYRIVYEREIPQGQVLPHTQKDGPVRVADMILMAAPKELHDAIYAEAARIARIDSALPVQEYRDAIREKAEDVGHEGQALGDVKFSSDSLGVDLDKLSRKAEAESSAEE